MAGYMVHTPKKTKENPKLSGRPISGGRKALYLEYYLGYTSTQKLDADGNPMYYTEGASKGRPVMETKHNRRKEGLGMYVYTKPRTAAERAHNDAILAKAREIRNERERGLLVKKKGYIIPRKDGNVIDYFEDYLAEYAKTDVRNMRLALNRFKTFLRLRYPVCVTLKGDAEQARIRAAWEESHKGIHGKHDINPNEFYVFSLNPRLFTEKMVREFVDWLQDNSEGSGAATAYSRFKKMTGACFKSGLIPANPCAEVVCKSGAYQVKDILSPKEIAMLQKAHVEGENEDVRRAFLFSLYTGVRFCDVKALRYCNIDRDNGILKFKQEKTDKLFDRPISAAALELAGVPEERGRSRDDLVFPLPTHTSCLKSLRRWCAAAGIVKHITWHSARHTFGTLLLDGGATAREVADLLGHSGLKYVVRYTRAIDERERRALESLPPLER